MDKSTKGLLAGLAVGAGLLWLFFKKRPRDEEDRPVMVVKSGSLVIQSGSDSANPGKRWKKVGEEGDKDIWQMDHPGGKHTNQFRVSMFGTGRCGPRRVRQLRLGTR